MNKEVIIEKALKNFESVNEFVDFLKKSGADPYDIDKDPKGLIRWYHATKEYVAKNHVILEIQTESQLINFIDSLIAEFQNFVENNAGWKLLYADDGRPRSEEICQLAFLGLVKHICYINNIDISREANIGRGPVDFKLSIGVKVRALIEMKLARNTKFWNGLEKQLPKYLQSEGIKVGKFLIIAFESDDPSKIKSAQKRAKELSQKTPFQYRGGSPILFQHLFWFFGHPEVYIVALPAFGIVSDLIATHARRNIFGYRMMVWAIVAIGALSFVVWAHHMYISGMNPYFGFFFATTTLIIAIPTAIKVYNWVLTLWRGDIHLTVPMLFALGFIVTFVNGGLTGLFLGNALVDVPLSGTMFVVAHFHMVMGVAPILVIMGAIYHWYPKVTGRMLGDRLGKVHFWFTFLGAYLIYFPMHYLGLLGVPRRYYELGETGFVPPSAVTLNEFITIAALVVGGAQMLFLFNIVWSLFRGKLAPPNPWHATTLEWQTPETPPGHGNWGKELPVVYRWAYEYSPPRAKEDFVPQNQPPIGIPA